MTDYATWTDEQVDVAIMERLFGWTEVRCDRGLSRISGIAPGESICRSATVRPTQDAAAMLDVINAMGKRGYRCELSSPWYPDRSNPVWCGSFAGLPGEFGGLHAYQSATPMRAVAIAALMTLESTPAK